MGTTTRIQSLCLLVLLVSVHAAAFEIQDGRLSINGFGSWGYGWSNHGNTYDIAQPTGNFGAGDFALALTARLSDRAVAVARVVGPSREPRLGIRRVALFRPRESARRYSEAPDRHFRRGSAGRHAAALFFASPELGRAHV